MPFSQELQRGLSKGFGFQTEVSLFSSTTTIVGIIDAVRTIVLNWSLKLEEEGVLGEGLGFTAQEKEAASKSPQHITNFYGPVHSPQIQQGTEQSMQISAKLEIDLERVAEFVGELRDTFAALDLQEGTSDEAKAEMTTIEAQLGSPKPKASIVRQSLSSIRAILEGAGGGAAAHLLVELGKTLM